MEKNRRVNRTRGNNPHTLVANWNELHPVGTAVSVEKDDRSIVDGVTTSEAYVMGGHTAVIHVDTVRGCYALERVTARPQS